MTRGRPALDDLRTLHEKRLVAAEAARLVEGGMRVGLGSGSTVSLLIDALAELAPGATFATASPESEEHTRRVGLAVEPLDRVGRLDLALDSADQVDRSGWLVKGGGRAQTREHGRDRRRPLRRPRLVRQAG